MVLGVRLVNSIEVSWTTVAEDEEKLGFVLNSTSQVLPPSGWFQVKLT